MPIVRGLITLAQARQSIYGNAYSTAPTTMDADIESYISAATPVIEEIAGPMYAESRTVTFDGGGHTLILPFRFNAVTSITVDGVAETSYVAEPTVGLIHGGTSALPDDFDSGTQNVVVVVTVGYATIPPNVVLATRELVRLWWQVGRNANRPGTAEQDGPGELPMGLRKRVSELLAPSAGLPGFA